MSGRTRLGVIAAAVAVAVAGFVIASGGDDTKRKSTASTTVTTPTATGTTTAPTKPKPPEPPRIVIEGGKPAGGVEKIRVRKGDRVRFTVVSDVADEVHVHGYDLHKDVAKGGSVSFDFPARIDGEFEAELERRGEQILALTVEP
jgi:FtsP/CotA-like multicopper oxidase with cupredoxin domain